MTSSALIYLLLGLGSNRSPTRLSRNILFCWVSMWQEVTIRQWRGSRVGSTILSSRPSPILAPTS